MPLSQQSPVETEAYHHVLGRIARSINEVFAVAEQLLQLVCRQVGAETFYPEIEEESKCGVVGKKVGRLLVVPRNQGAVDCRFVWDVVLQLQAGGPFQRDAEYLALVAEQVAAYEHGDIYRSA